MHSDELVSDRPELGVANPRSRSNIKRNTANKVAVECFMCGKKEFVSSILAVGYNKAEDENTYQCNDCNSSRNREKRNS